jgi:hypothetical protein
MGGDSGVYVDLNTQQVKKTESVILIQSIDSIAQGCFMQKIIFFIKHKITGKGYIRKATEQNLEQFFRQTTQFTRFTQY